MNCRKCEDSKRPIHSPARGLCFYCYTQELNGKSLERIESSFTPASPYNQKLFSLYTTQIKKSYIKNSELPIARKWSEALSKEGLNPFRTWGEVLSLSEKLGIRHGSSKTRGCPVIKTARILAQLGELHPLCSDEEHKFKVVIDQFYDPLKTQVEAFRVEISARHMKMTSSVKILRAILQLSNFIPKEEKFWLIRIKTAQDFLDQLPSNGVCDYSEHLKALTRFFNWGLTKGLTESNPFLGIEPKRLIRVCSICEKEKIFRTHDKLCHECNVDRKYGAKIEAENAIFTPKSTYNKSLYELYLKYINRFMLQTEHYRATLKLQKFLSEKEIPPLKTWTDVTLLSRRFKEIHGQILGGCPIEKIGRMLQELSVLSIREEDPEIYLLREINVWKANEQSLAKRYVQVLRNQKRTVASARGTLTMIRAFNEWLESEGTGANLFTAQEMDARNYCDKLGVTRVEVHVRVLSKFYRWSTREKLTFINPFESIKTSKRIAALQICDDVQIREFEKFIKSKDSDPELALILALVLYWGFTAKNIAWATLDISDSNQLKIILHRESLSYRNKEHRRNQTLTLPISPKWLLDLQVRYAHVWQSKHESVRKNFPLRPLILHKQGLHNRPLRTLAIVKRFEKATLLACGYSVPMNIVRRTSGHIYSIQGDAAVLTEMGWSKDYSFDFMWRPRRLFTGKKK